MKRNILLILMISLFIFCDLSAQISREKWEKLEGVQGDELFVNVNGIRKIKNKDIIVWTMQKHSIPLVIESVGKKISKTKTSYLFNPNLKKYSLLEVIYYDNNNGVLKSFSYRNNSKLSSYKYNFPVIPGSEMELILNKCLKVLENM